MSKIIEILSGYGAVAGLTVPAQFTVDVSAAYVEAVYTPAHDVPEFALVNGGGLYTLNPADNFNIVSAGVSVPYPFSFYDEQFVIKLEFYDDETNPVTVPGFGDGNGLVFPFENYELPLDIFFSVPDNTMGTRQFGAQVLGRDGNPLKISMLNIPADLDTLTFNVSVFLKVIHNFPLS
jgi:hypothetical protein